MKKIVLGMMAVAITFSSMAQTTNSPADKDMSQQKESRHGRSHHGHWLDKLNLSDAQKSQIKTINGSFRQQMHDLRKQGSITVDEQKQKREALVKEHREKVDAILTPEQRQQAATMRKEFKGGRDGAHNERFREMTKDLNLTPDQTEKMTAINSTFKTNLQNIKQNTSLTEDQKRDEMKSLMKQHRSDVEALLTSDQKEQMKSRLRNRPNRTAVK